MIPPRGACDGGTHRGLAVQALDADTFAAFGTVIAPGAEGQGFGASDAVLDLTLGTPRFYTMRLRHRPLCVHRITRHRRTTQVLAAAGGHDWWIVVAPPHEVDNEMARPRLDDIRAFCVPGDTAVMLLKGTWHAGPYFTAAEASFFNLELADTNVTDHQSCDLVACYGTALLLQA